MDGGRFESRVGLGRATIVDSVWLLMLHEGVGAEGDIGRLRHPLWQFPRRSVVDMKDWWFVSHALFRVGDFNNLF